ncbi:YkgJ family cysteine cluster protein [Mesorhizobium sp. SB112]|uniref:YkgJ family cysteine cluster protein n=1 Tax=Mesorhizobium sp. SB112 TaxID=3151853 RepID=UPI003264A6D0
MSQAAADRITPEVAFIGAQMRVLAERYEGVFVTLHHTLKDELSRSASLSEGALIAMTIADAAASALVTHLPNQPTRDCRAGCAACCHLYVMVPPGVVEVIGDYLTDRLDSEALATLQDSLERAAAAAQAAPDPSQLRHRCPFLGTDGLCTIYEVRPPTCRAFTSTSAVACHSMAFDPEGGVSAIPQNPSQFRVYVEATTALEHSALARGLPSRQTGLAAAVLAALPSSSRTHSPNTGA